MLKKVFVAITFGMCVCGLTLTGCSSGPTDINVDKDAKPSKGEGQGEMEGVKAPDGMVTAD
ncbi:MAG: hypothetical protein ACR2NP_01740 [Pirellulaceae bacterium]